MTEAKWQSEEAVDDYTRDQVKALDLELGVDYGYENYIPETFKDAFKGASKTKNKTGIGKPDQLVYKYNVPVVFENKLSPNNFEKRNAKGELAMNQTNVNKYALNGAYYYGQALLRSKKWKECIIIATAGNNESTLRQSIYYMPTVNAEPKRMRNYENKGLTFLANQTSFNQFLHDAQLTPAEKHNILIQSQKDLEKEATKLNKLFNNLSISVQQRATYVAGMLLAMHDVVDYHTGETYDVGLTPADLTGNTYSAKSDGHLIINQINEFLTRRGNIATSKRNIMVSVFRLSIDLDADRNKPQTPDKIVAKMIPEPKASINKQIFTFIYENVYKQINENSGTLDIMGQLYQNFLSFAASNGKNLGQVLTPTYVTNLMADLIDVNKDSRVMDLATGSAAFLVSSMQKMIDNANYDYGTGTNKANAKIENIKHTQLLGIEKDQNIFVIGAVSMLVRGDGSSTIIKGDSFEQEKAIANFKGDRLLLNPPFSYEYNGMPFLQLGLDHMQKGGKAAIIIQDSAGSGKAQVINQKILEHNTLLMSIKMPTDLFEPNAGVQTSIYVFDAGIPHDFNKIVKFIDFRNDGYKRTKRGLNEIDHPTERYQDIVMLAKYGKTACLKNNKFHQDLWDLDKQYVEDTISDDPEKEGTDFNFEGHIVIDTTPRERDFLVTVGQFLSFQVDQILRGETND